MRLVMPASTLARAALDQGGQAARTQRLHAFDPAHRAKGLAKQRIADPVGVLLHSHIDVVDHGQFEASQRP